MIVFKNRDHYACTDFNSRYNLSAWFKKASKSEAKIYITEWFQKRKKRKNIIWSPCQVELRSLPIPGIKYIQDVIDCSYFKFCEELGFKNKFNLVDFSGKWDILDNSHEIMIDSREQLPLEFNNRTLVTNLPFADYALNDMEMSKHGFIERKSVNDLYGTMIASYMRFQKELNRARNAGAYIVVIVEGSFAEVSNYPQSSKHIRIAPEVIWHRVRTLIQDNDHIQFLFVNNRDDSSKAIKRIFTSMGQYKHIDLQLAYDLGKLI
jgi:hypothetical protein